MTTTTGAFREAREAVGATLTEGDDDVAMVVEVVRSLAEVDPAAWDALLPPHNPFVEHAFLSLLETSQSAVAETGWQPLHLVVRDEDRLVGAAPCYLKSHSQGEYIFDYAWAEAAMRAGLDYYPKLVVGVPLTPATGPRLLARDDERRPLVWRALVEGLVALTHEADAGGAHVLFSLPEEAAFLEEHGFLRRATHQFHWRNHNYRNFDDFLGALKSQARKQIRKERRAVSEAGLTVELRRGDELSADEWSTLFALYQHTGSRKWGTPYLTR
ncbi:MAG: peptidogalycan biosysnthesis protein, partial [Myxococcota bacterium]